MRIKIFTALACFGISTMLSAQYKYGPNLLENGDFENGAEKWVNLEKGGKVISGAGRNKSNGFVYSRSDNGYCIVKQNVPVKKLEKGKFYEFGGYAKQLQGSGGAFCAEFYGEKYMGGVYPQHLFKPSNWVKITNVIRYIPEDASNLIIAVYMRKKSKGKVAFDDVYLREIKNYWQIRNISTAFPLIENEVVNLQFKVECSDLGSNKPIIIIRGENIKFQKRILSFTFDKGTIAFKFKFPKSGKYNINFDFGGKKLNSEIVVSPRREPVVVIDNFNRIKVSGKKFLPIGVYTNGIKPEYIDIIAKSPFNTVLPYDSMKWKLPQDKKCSVATIKKLMDKFAEKDIKIIFSVKDVWKESRWPKLSWFDAKGETGVIKKVVETFKNHKALLAWYIADELPPGMSNDLTVRKNLVNSLDSNHLALSVYCHYSPLYVGTCNIFGADPYPVTFDGVDRNNMISVLNALEKIKAMYAPNLHPPLWAIPQAFNWGVYSAKNEKDYHKYRFPTAQEMRSMNFLYIIYGAKGFIFYSFMDLFRGPDKKQFENNWPVMCEAAKQLKDLQGFILSDYPAETLKVKVLKGNVKAKLLKDENGKYALIIAAVGPGPAKAEIIVPKALKLKSKFGKTKAVSTDKYLFEGNNIDSDLLKD